MIEKPAGEDRELGKNKSKEEVSGRTWTKGAPQEGEEKFCLLAETTSEAVLMCDQKKEIIYVNKVCLELTGYSREEALEMSITEFISSDDFPRIEAACERPALRRGNDRHYETEAIHKTGNRIPIDVRISRIINYDKSMGFLLVARDLSERKKAEMELLKVQKLESIGALAGGIAHDYNNILGVIIGNISLAQTYLKPEQEVFNVLKAAQRASEQAKNLTKRLLTFSKGGSPNKKVVSISAVIESAVDFTLSGSNVKCEYSLPEHLWPVEIDESQIGQAIYNLVVNSMEAMPKGGMLRVGAENTRIDQEDSLTPKQGKYLRISIEDHGTGIPEEVLGKIFEPYFSTKEMGKQKGMGLGLSISHSIIKKHGGDIQVASKEGEGTTFFIYLPATEKAITTVVPAKRKLKEPSFPGMGKVLVMDDEEMIRKLCRQMLVYLGYEVVLSEDGGEAIELYKEAMESGHPFDLVMLDLTVRGGIGGEETISRLAEIDPGVKGIVSSGYSDNPILSDYESYGFCDAIAKPYKVHELGRALNRVLRRQPSDRHKPE